MSIEYLKALHAAYEAFIRDIARVIPVIKVDYSKFRTAEQMAAAIKIQYAAISNIKHVGLANFKDHPKQPPAPHKA